MKKTTFLTLISNEKFKIKMLFRNSMEKQEKAFLALFFAFLIITIANLSNETALKAAHALTRHFFGGLSTGKLLVILAVFTIMPLLCLAALKTKVCKVLEKKQKLFLAGFATASIILLIVGFLQFNYFSQEFKSNGPFATLLKEGAYENWEASKLSHNHFPKITLYFLEKNLGINTGSLYDDGKPLFLVFPNAELWSIAFLLVLLAMIAFGLLHAFSVCEKIKVFDFVVFTTGFLSLIINGIDGGVGSSIIMIGVFLLVLYWFRNYFKIENRFRNLLPIAFFGLLLVLLVGVFSIDITNEVFAIPMVITIGLLYYLGKEFKEKKLKTSLPLNFLLALVLLISLNNVCINLNVFYNGKWVVDFSKDPTVRLNLQEGDGLFIYGIPENASEQEIESGIGKFGKILEFDRVGWTAYARILPFKPFQSGELENSLIKKLKPEHYFYVEENVLLTNSADFKLYLLQNEKPVVLDSEFLGIKVLKQEFDDKTNSISISIKGKYELTWEMLAILTEAQSKGLTKQALLVKS